MSEGEWTTVTSKNSTSHKAPVPRPISFASVAASADKTRQAAPIATSFAAKAAAAAATANPVKSASNNKQGAKNTPVPATNKKPAQGNQSHHSHGNNNNKAEASASGAAAKATSTRSRSSSYSSTNSEDSQSDSALDGGASATTGDRKEKKEGHHHHSRVPFHTAILIHCPFQSCTLTDPILDSTRLVAHLQEAHKIAFKNIHHMFVLLEGYLNYWAHEIDTKGLDAVAIKHQELATPVKDTSSVEGDAAVTGGAEDSTAAETTITPPSEYYVIDPAVSAADRTLRDDLQREKLKEILKQQEKERHSDAKLKRKCLFCKNVCDNRTILFKHMFAEHNFNIGLPDNLVNVNEFLQMLEAKLSNQQCLYCEKTFTSAAVLRKHMRKKKHFKISARNRLYDQFYVINYLEPGKNWENFEHDKYESDDDNNAAAARRDDSWADWDDALEEESKTVCLFCPEQFTTVELARAHMIGEHGFDLDGTRVRMGLDFYQTITMINYIRRQTMQLHCFSCGKKQETKEGLIQHLKDHKECGAGMPSLDQDFWKDAQYLLPMLENDPLLMVFTEEDVDAEASKDVAILSDDDDDESFSDDDDDDEDEDEDDEDEE